MIGLGWTSETATVPDGLRLHGDGPIRALCAPTAVSKTARDRLGMQVRSFDAGIDLLPIAPSHQISSQQAISMMRTADMAPIITQLKTKGQLTLSVQQPQIATDPISDGRSWLAARKNRHDVRANQADLLHHIAALAGRPVSPLRRTNHCVQCDILVERSEADKLKDQLAHHLHGSSGLVEGVISITGLWPPFGFADLQRLGASAA